MFSLGPRIHRRFLRTRIRSLLVRPSPSAPPAPAAPAIPAGPPPPPPPPEGLTAFSYHWETVPPTPTQLSYADSFFTRGIPSKHLWSQAKFGAIEIGTSPEVVFLGRSNVGKSSLLNAMMGHAGLAFTSSKPGRTRLLSAFAVNGGKAVVVDCPGYGHASREEWGVQVMKYLKSRKQFRRAFVLLDARHGPKSSDIMLLEHLGREGISFQVVLSKVDAVNQRDGSLRGAFEDTKYLLETGIAGVTGLGEVIGVAPNPAKKGVAKIGISQLRWSVLVACGLDAGVK